MKLLRLALAYLRERPLNTFLNLFLLALGVAMIVVLLLFANQVEERLARDSRGVDLVVGAKGSPLQLILSSIYHIDTPTGNIPLAEANKLRAHPMIKSAIPLALGDSVAGYRIVGTEPAYVNLYEAKLAHGDLWKAPSEATLGAQVAKTTGMKAGDTFTGAHGMGAGGGEHKDSPYKVAGVLAPTGSIIDRLVLTSIESVWEVHEHHEKDQGHEEREAARQARDAQREVTSLLVQYKTPLAAATMPRFINSQSALQAAAPAFETARLLNLIGFGLDTLRAFAGVLIVSAILSMLIALTNALEERRYDLAIMRTLGGSRGWLFLLVLLQGVILALVGTALGMLLGHAAAQAVGMWFNITRQMSFTGLTWVREEWWLVVVAVAIGVLAAILPALSAYRTDIAKTLARE
jgi:putative ABC transport system permease protein